MFRVLCGVANVMGVWGEAWEDKCLAGQGQRRLPLDSWLDFPPARLQHLLSLPLPARTQPVRPPFVTEALAISDGAGLEMAGGTDGQAGAEGARNSLSPTKGPWVFTALGMICELMPPCFLPSKHPQFQQPRYPAPGSFPYHVAT